MLDLVHLKDSKGYYTQFERPGVKLSFFDKVHIESTLFHDRYLEEVEKMAQAIVKEHTNPAQPIVREHNIDPVPIGGVQQVSGQNFGALDGS